MEITAKEACQALQGAESIAKGVREKLLYGFVGPILILWGAVWMVCFAISHFAPHIAGWGWLIGAGLGDAGSIYIGRRRKKAGMVRSEASRRLGRKLLAFWLFLTLFGGIGLAMLWPWRGEQLGAFLVTQVMFGYVVMGLWMDKPFLVWLGLAVTALAGTGYALSFFVPGYLDLWLGFTGGSALLASGFYLTLRWR